MADQTIIIQYVVEADDAIQESERMRQVVNAMKSDIKSLAAESRQSFKDLGRAMVKEIQSLSSEKEGSKEALANLLKIDPDTIQNNKEFAQAKQEALTSIRKAVVELGQEERAQAQQTTKVVKDAKAQEKAAQLEYEKVTRQGYGVMSAAAQAYGQQVNTIKQQIVTQSKDTGKSYQEVAENMQKAGTNANVLNSALKQLNQEATKTKSSFSNLGDVIKAVFVGLLGLNIINLLRSVIALLKEAAQAGYELSKAFFQLEVGARAIRRAGVDITSKEILDNLDKLREKFGIFSRKELVVGAAAFINLIRDMGLTKEQIFELQDAIATLAIVNGRSMDEVQRTVALALSSGYTEGLQRLGVSINRVTIAARAMTMGFEGGYNALNEHERAMATLSLITEKTAKYSDDLTKYLELEVGQLDAAIARNKDMAATIGDDLIPLQKIWNELLYSFYNVLGLILKIFTPLIVTINAFVDASKEINYLNIFKKEFWTEQGWNAANSFMEAFSEGIFKFIRGKEVVADIDLKGLKFSLKDAELGDSDLGTPTFGEAGSEDSADNVRDIVDELHDDIEKATRDHNNRMAELERDLARDLEKIDRDLASDLVDLWFDKERDIENIKEEGRRKQDEAIADYDRKLLQEERKYNLQVAEANAKYRENEIQAEIDYQERLRKLREGFLYDLEDALHERDARQILSLIRRYNLEKDQTQRQFTIEQEERRRQHQLQLAEMAAQRDERLRILAEEQAVKIAAMQQEVLWDVEMRKRKYELENADRKRKAKQDKDERAIRQEEMITELKIDFENRTKEIVIALANEKNMTAQMLEAIGNEYKRIYGPNGVIEAQIMYYIGLLNALAAAASKVSSPRPPNFENKNKGLPPTSWAEGGIAFADKPTTAIFGEAGPEMAEFTPLNRVGKNEGKVVQSDLRGSNGRDGTISLRVLLSPELVAEIQENTLEQVANVMFEVQRSRQ